MDNNQKLAIVGSGLVAAGLGLGLVGTAMMMPAVFGWAVRIFNRRTVGFSTKVESASKTIGSVAGTLHRSFNAARKAGVAELRRQA